MLGIYGGTFDPIHYGHLRTALDVKEAAGLDALWLVPCRLPPHRETPGASAAQRLGLLRAALAGGEPGFAIDTRELDRPGPSYMVDTLASIREEVGNEPLVLIVGMDAFRGLHRWHRWERLFELAHVIVMQRPEPESDWAEDLRRVWAERRLDGPESLRRKPAGGILWVPVTQLDISATRIRTELAAGHSARYLAPEPVLALIREWGLYGAAPVNAGR